MPLLIEFVGPSGVGKSTIAKHVQKEISRFGLNAWWIETNQLRPLQIISGLRLLLSDWHLCNLLIRYRRGMFEAVYAIRKLWIAQCALEIARKWNGDVILLGEGLFQKLNTARKCLITSAVLDILPNGPLNAFPVPDVAVYLTASDYVIAARRRTCAGKQVLIDSSSVPNAKKIAKEVDIELDLKHARKFYGMDIWEIVADDKAVDQIVRKIIMRLGFKNKSAEYNQHSN